MTLEHKPVDILLKLCGIVTFDNLFVYSALKWNEAVCFNVGLAVDVVTQQVWVEFNVSGDLVIVEVLV